MKQLIFFLTIFPAISFSLMANAQSPAFKIEVSINGYDGKEVFLGYRRADKTYSKDTAALVNGKYIFEGQEPLPPGIYLVLMPPDNKFFEFVVTKAEQKFSMQTTAPDFFKNLKFKGSKENQLLLDYQNFMGDQVKKSKELQEQIVAEKDAKKKTDLEQQLDKLAKSVRKQQDKLMQDNPGTYMAKVIRAFQDPEIPELPKKPDGTLDSSFQWKYYKAHYWDGFDFSDEIFVNTPYLKEKTDRYLDKMTVLIPDSVIAAADLVLTKAQANQEVFRYLLPYLLNKYYNPEIMGLDALYVHLSDTYYASGIADWVTPENLKKITDDAFMMRGILIGRQAPNIKVQQYDPVEDKFTNNLISPYDVKADYTIIFLWKPGCGHCKHLSDELKPFYEEWKNKGVEVFSISSANQSELEEAIKDIHEKKMPWIITADPYLRARALQNYYGTSLPKLYLLDKDKKIIANRVGVKQLPDIIANHRKMQQEQRK
jgi:thiol-disulfide isomerase/thioredoxin